MNTDECRLMQRVQAGELDKLAILFECNKARLYSYFRKSGNSPSHAEDLVQETFMRILAYRSGFSGEGSFRSWMYGIARNTAADHMRKQGRHQHDPLPDDAIASDECVQDVSIQQQRQSCFEQALQALEHEDRDMIVLSRFAQLNYDEIASLLQCNLNTLKSRMRAAINRLQQKFEQLYQEDKG